MNRRSFLKRLSSGASVLATGGLLGNRASALHSVAPTPRSAAAGSLPIRKAVKFHMLESDDPIREQFRILRDAGFEGVEFRSPNDHDTDAIVRAQEETGLEVIGVVAGWKHFGSTDPAVRQQSHEELDAALQNAADYGASIVLLVPETVNAEMPYDQAYHRSLEEISKALPRAEALGVQIAIENVWNQFLLSPLEFAEYIDAFDSDYVGAYFDVGNVVKHGWPEQWIRILGDRILRIDVKGFSRELMNNQGPSAGFEADIGEGSVDWSAVRSALSEVGYQGWATAEESGGDAVRMQEIVRQMDRVLPTE